MTTDAPYDDSDHHLLLRHLTSSDYQAVNKLQGSVYHGLGGAFRQRSFESQINTFPEGQFCIEDKGQIVAAAFSVIVDYDKFGDKHTYNEITGDTYLTTHDPNGDVLYGVEFFVHPEYRGMRLGRRLYEARKELCRNLNLKSIMAGGRIPNYRQYADSMTPFEYIQQVKEKEIHDPTLSFQLANDFEVKQVLKGYLPEDKESLGYATLLQWHNMYYEAKTPSLIQSDKSTARIACIQWQMRHFESVEAMLQQVEFFVDAVADYKCDLAIFPEFFNAPLMGLSPSDQAIDAIWHLAEYSETIVNAMTQLALSYNINIVAGSIPVIEDDELVNIAYFCHRDGRVETQYKIHPTPHEKQAWLMKGGDTLNVFDTDIGKLGVLICYDIEFPELARLLSEQEIKLLCVPFWTDTKNGYLRVRRCAQARAIENECYVAIAGSVGNLPQVDNVDLQYGQSAVFSPSDFAFAHDAIVSETTPNTEMTLIADLDFTKLTQLQNEGSVRNFLDRRRDLYQVVWKGEK